MRYKSLIIFALPLIVAMGSADTLNLSLSEVLVQNRGVVNRILISFNISALRDCRVDYAEILIPHFLTQGAITIEAWRLRSENPDDYDTTYHSRYVTDAEIRLPVILDITEFVKHWQKNGNNFGILLKRPHYEGGGFRGELQALRNALTNARVRVFFVRTRR
uniref:Uncharacterized protein n=1 Tax=candidate division WOR-3 bacterium TaxID=2052148 RepID=A0A7C6A9G6_UNCW3